MRIERVDERFTSKMAAQSLIAGGVKKKKRQNKALLDEISATIILQSYLYNLFLIQLFLTQLFQANQAPITRKELAP